MNKKCHCCGKEFTSIFNKGDEQMYCSKYCRNKAANDRRIERIKDNARLEVITETQKHIQPTKENQNFGYMALPTDIERISILENTARIQIQMTTDLIDMFSRLVSITETLKERL
jgi:hypothetical protein